MLDQVWPSQKMICVHCTLASITSMVNTLLMSTSPPSHSRSARSKLSRRQIIECALTLVRTEGLTALSMRRIATEMGTGPMSLYRHIADRDDLLVGMLDHVALAIEAPPSEPDDRQEIVAIMMTIHQTFRADPWLVHVLLFEGQGSLKVLPLFDRIFAALAGLGCDHQQALDQYCLLLHYTYGDCLSFQTRHQRRSAQTDWNADTLDNFPATQAIRDAIPTWKHDEFERNLQRLVANICPGR